MVKYKKDSLPFCFVDNLSVSTHKLLFQESAKVIVTHPKIHDIYRGCRGNCKFHSEWKHSDRVKVNKSCCYEYVDLYLKCKSLYLEGRVLLLLSEGSSLLMVFRANAVKIQKQLLDAVLHQPYEYSCGVRQNTTINRVWAGAHNGSSRGRIVITANCPKDRTRCVAMSQ